MQEHDEDWIQESEKDTLAMRGLLLAAWLLSSATANGQTQSAAKPVPAPIRPFKMHVPDRVLVDLRRRLAVANWPDQLPGATWEYGADIKKVRELADYWQNGYDWRAQEAKINQLDQFTTEIDGQQIYFIHQRLFCGIASRILAAQPKHPACDEISGL